MKRILIPLPTKDFDPTEAAIPWKMLTQAGHAVVFATPDGTKAEADFRMVCGAGLGPFKKFLMADKNGVSAYKSMHGSPEFDAPIRYAEIGDSNFDGLILPGGHAPAVKEYLESSVLQEFIAGMMGADKPVGAVCHGVVLVARSINPATGRSVLHGRKTTGLPNKMELSAWALTKLWLGNYYRTYPQTVQDEIIESLASPDDYFAGPSSILRDNPDKLERGFTVCDRRYLSARWPGDIHRFVTEFLLLLEEN
ncbi:MAG: hypothetical protein DWQ05_17655 [Calditrichaeota bacterium]|nr:MAG: hypothetical protein DWQ05_17655 [Calditrichota bacterium]